MCNMKSNYFIYLTLVLYISMCAGEFSPLVEIKQGPLRGIVKEDYKGGKFYSFLSIPYARKPIGKLRFMIPVTPNKWEGTLYATEDMPMCLQKDWSGKILGQEDCLYLNVHTPELNTKALKPVMVFIHGGGYVEGHGRYEMFGPEFLMPEGVLLVTINYRLGLFGFLNFDNSDVGVFGNMGLKDQNMALRWVQKNIEKFGGDPKCVTIFGESAGGASVHLHMLSPMSQGLFHRVIAQSGAALNPWSTNGQKNTGVFAAKFLGYTGKSEMKMLPFLQEVSFESIFKVQENMSIIIPIHEPCLAAPIVENIEDSLAFLPEDPAKIISSKNFVQVPFILGFTDEEGIVFDGVPLAIQTTPEELAVEKTLLHDFNFSDEKDKLEAAKKIKDFYYKNGDSMDRLSVFRHAGDAWLYWGLVNAALAHAKISHQNLYMYMLSADTKLNYFKHLNPITAKYAGASHLDDLGYIFKTKFTPDMKPDSIEVKAMERVVKLWTNFAKYGNPTPRNDDLEIIWKSVEDGALNYLNIRNEGLSMEIDPFAERIAFWNKLKEEYGSGNEKVIHTEL